jgi:hypothetical protein
MSNVVIYEENDLMRGLLAEWLSEAGYRVHPAASHDLSACPCPNTQARS